MGNGKKHLSFYRRRREKEEESASPKKGRKRDLRRMSRKCQTWAFSLRKDHRKGRQGRKREGSQSGRSFRKEQGRVGGKGGEGKMAWDRGVESGGGGEKCSNWALLGRKIGQVEMGLLNRERKEKGDQKEPSKDSARWKVEF